MVLMVMVACSVIVGGVVVCSVMCRVVVRCVVMRYVVNGVVAAAEAHVAVTMRHSASILAECAKLCSKK